MKNVLVTGAGSGIGYSICLKLAENNFQVFAGVRNEEDFKKFSSSNNVTPLFLDITNQNHVDEASSTLRNNGGLYCLINNAGTVIPGALLEVNNSDLIKQFEINLFKPLSLIKTLFPLLQESKGKIINIGSLNGIIPSPYSGGVYSMSKYGMEAMTQILKTELSKFDIQVCLVDPGQFNTPIFYKIIKNLQNLLDQSTLYQKEYQEVIHKMNQSLGLGRDTEIIANLILDLLESEKLSTRYLSGRSDEQRMIYRYLLKTLKETIDLSSEKLSLEHIINELTI